MSRSSPPCHAFHAPALGTGSFAIGILNAPWMALSIIVLLRMAKFSASSRRDRPSTPYTDPRLAARSG
jgi:hypothetical protein